MTFLKSTAIYEKWLAGQLKIVPADLKQKHELMRSAIFPFLRATFYRWAEIWPEVCADCAEAPEVLAVGDLHVENFGTWRDVEGRLIWGINDFDEVARMPYTIDLVRLGASAHLAIEVERLRIDRGEACHAILAGYREGLESGGMPWVLAGKHPWLRDMVYPGIRDGAAFWKKLNTLPELKERVPGSARRAIEKLMPGKTSGKWRMAHRVAGLGSLGRERFVAIGEFDGSFVCREAKALAPSAWELARGKKSGAIRYQKALDVAVRAKDPFVRLQGRWIVRRLAPDCTRVDLALFPQEREESKLLHAMGWETANLHLGSGMTLEILADLDKRPEHWLHKAAAKMVAATNVDWEVWRKAHPVKKGRVARAAGH
jgi:uncharacterized protein (DUF2252 family)